MSNTTSKDDGLDSILDNHAELYARTTMQFITGEITEEERDKEWHHSDLKTKHLIERYGIQERIDVTQNLRYAIMRGEYGHDEVTICQGLEDEVLRLTEQLNTLNGKEEV